MRRIQLLLSVATLVGAFTVSGCSSEEGGGTCAASSDCARGLACLEDGSCGTYDCTGVADCFQEGDFQETCLQEGADGAFDPQADGVCTDEECRSDRDCEDSPNGPVCRNSACYAEGSGPVACDCRQDCPGGQICLRGECAAPVGVCGDTCECPLGSVCDGGACVAGTDPCDTVSCGENEECVDGDCVGTNCDPPCTDGQVCDAATATCVADTPNGTLCNTCTSSDECGGEADACITISETQTICGRSCGDSAPCPDGYSCLPVDTRVGSQCIPGGGNCAGCLVTGCGDGEFCDPFTTECEALADDCDACNTDAECQDGSVCAEYGGSKICLSECEIGGAACGTGFECGSLGDVTACAPTSGGCGGSGCELTADDCVDPLGVLDTARCICVACVDATDCAEGQTCTSGGNCVSGGRPCSTTAECDGGYCQGGVCVDCLTPGDCSPDEICIAGACEPCDCGPDERCNSAGECVEVPDPTNCTSDSQCVAIARDLGFSGEGATCDSEIGCFTAGTCNGAGGGIDLGFGGETDPFNAPCPSGSCVSQLDIFSPSFFTFACGCTEGDASTCREGETCAAPPFDLLGTGPVCGTGGGGGFPLPFP